MSGTGSLGSRNILIIERESLLKLRKSRYNDMLLIIFPTVISYLFLSPNLIKYV